MIVASAGPRVVRLEHVIAASGNRSQPALNGFIDGAGQRNHRIEVGTTAEVGRYRPPMRRGSIFEDDAAESGNSDIARRIPHADNDADGVQSIDDPLETLVLNRGQIDLALFAKLGGIQFPERHRVALD